MRAATAFSCCAAAVCLALFCAPPPANGFNFFRGNPRHHLLRRRGASQQNALSGQLGLIEKRSGVIGAGGFLMIGEAPPKMLQARQHGKTVLECSASGNPAPQITWLKDGHPLIKEFPGTQAAGGYGDFAVESMSETKSRIELECVSEADAGLYECVAHTDKKKTSVGTEVTVVSESEAPYARDEKGFEPNGCTPRRLTDFSSAPPVIFQWMGTYLQLIGTDAHLICRAEGHHATQWTGPEETAIFPGQKYKILDNGDLIIHDLTFDDMGMYKCEASNENGSDAKETFLYPHSA